MTDHRASQQRANRRLGLILLSVALIFGVGFFARMAFFGH
ncbi:MAG: cytochrome oxidase small assembly protein [Aquabacterium sp.]